MATFFDIWEKEAPVNVKLRPHLLWDICQEDIDYQKIKELVVQRVLERGCPNDYVFILRIYGGIEGVREIIKNLPKLSPKDEAFALSMFNLEKSDLLCYERKRLREVYLNS